MIFDDTTRLIKLMIAIAMTINRAGGGGCMRVRAGVRAPAARPAREVSYPSSGQNAKPTSRCHRHLLKIFFLMLGKVENLKTPICRFSGKSVGEKNFKSIRAGFLNSTKFFHRPNFLKMFLLFENRFGPSLLCIYVLTSFLLLSQIQNAIVLKCTLNFVLVV